MPECRVHPMMIVTVTLRQCMPSRNSKRCGSAPRPGGLTRWVRGQPARALRYVPLTQESPMSTDAIVILKDDHKAIKKLFKEFRDAGPDAKKKKADTVAKIIEALTVH